MTNIVEEKESLLISNLLRISLQSNLQVQKSLSGSPFVYLEDYFEELEKSGKSLNLRFTNIDDIIYYRLKTFFKSGDWKEGVLALQFLVESYGRFRNELSSTRLCNEVKNKISDCIDLLPKYGALLIQCPELFEVDNNVDIKLRILKFLEMAIPTIFMASMLDKLEANDPNCIESIWGPVIDKLIEKILGRTFMDLHMSIAKNIMFLSQFKQLVNVLTNRPLFLPSNNTNNNSVFGTSPGFTLQTGSLFGGFISPNPIDKSLQSKDNLNPIIQKYFSGILMKTQTQITQSKLSIKNELSLIHEQSLILFRNILKSNINNRRKVLKWIGLVCCSNEGRTKLFNAISGLSSLRNNSNTRSLQSSIQSLILRTSGQTTNGFSLNVLELILKLLEPVKIEKVPDLDYFYILWGKLDENGDIGNEVKSILGDLINEATLGDKEKIKQWADIIEAKKIDIENKKLEYNDIIRFPTQIFWLSCKAIIVFMHPILSEYENKIHELNEYRNNSSSMGLLRQDTEFERLTAELLLYDCTLFHTNIMTTYWHFLSIFCHFIIRSIYSFDKDGNKIMEWDDLIYSKQGRLLNAMRNFGQPSSSLSPQFSVLPSRIVDDIMTTTELILRIKGNDESIIGFDFDSYISLCISLISFGNYFNNPHSRCQKGVGSIHYLLQLPQYRQKIETNEDCIEFILPNLISLFNDVQKSPYFDRFSLRLPIIILLENLIGIESHRNRLYSFVKDRDEAFTKFIHLLVSDLNYLLEEGMSMLAEIKKREISNNANSDNLQTNNNIYSNDSNNNINITNQSSNQNNEDLEHESAYQNSDIQSSIEEMPLERLNQSCKGYMQLSHTSASLLQKITQYYPEEIIDSPLILPQIVTCLNSTLDRLVGPKCLELKVSNFESYNFNPRQLLANICLTYIKLSFKNLSTMTNSVNLSTNSEQEICSQLISEIIEEQRFFKVTTFAKAYHIVRREGLLNLVQLKQFGQLVKIIQERATEHAQGNQDILNIDAMDIPEEFLDPIMQDIMIDPVMLPTSSKIMDRRIIERILMSDGLDPFNRFPLSRSELIPQSELKQQIQEFISKYKKT
ncbi:U-box domain-containing protein [Cryptosporidium andersoni]|uniref:RING-type E3 ubiquitin transferase n=1 Tax=Cryptosporidium andersoni TaxID=117008 RepID=A0A1J4MU76_9CRYT|nr:U-box domain-containing protein [Cryptosporidium andersoni]